MKLKDYKKGAEVFGKLEQLAKTMISFEKKIISNNRKLKHLTGPDRDFLIQDNLFYEKVMDLFEKEHNRIKSENEALIKAIEIDRLTKYN